jgi:DNA-binding NarL/FixJ family response regulator
MRRPRLIIADDNPHVLRAVCGLLEDTFDIAGHAMDGEAALNAVLDLDPDVLVVDLSMPLMNGLEVASYLRRLNHRVRTVLLTLHEDLAGVACVDAVGVHAYVIKRRAATDLVPAIEQALSSSRRAAHAAECPLAHMGDT